MRAIGDGDFASLALLHEHRNHAAPATDHVAVAGATEARILGPGVGIGLDKHLFGAKFGGAVKIEGLTALSVLNASTRCTPWSMAASITLRPPIILVWMASNGLYSQAGTCFSAAACTTTVTPENARCKRCGIAHIADKVAQAGMIESRRCAYRAVSVRHG